jgi:hypothetical protein
MTMAFVKGYALWLVTFVGFPLGGLAAVTFVGSITSTVTGFLAGLISGTILGTAQWLVLRPRGISPLWIAVTSVGMAVGSGLATAVTSAGTSTGDLVLRGLISGAVVGIAQAFALRARLVYLWPMTVSATWALAWLITSNVIVDKDRGYVTFGASGAIIATAICGLVLYGILRPDFRSATSGPQSASVPAGHSASGGAR